MKVKIIRPFFGSQEARWLQRGEILAVSDERGEQMVKKGLAILVYKRKEPSEDKALRPSENKGIRNEGESA